MKPAVVKKYIKLIEQEGTNQLLLLLLEYRDRVHPRPKEFYIDTIQRFTEHLRKQLPVDKPPKQVDIEDSIAEIKKELTQCRAGRDGDCYHPQCPQTRDNEPHATGRHCPLDDGKDYDEEY